jgi:bifunctional UDP-N-acetylglucosamine pyrophosphorylase/glucosamine-1-phosphate N-acetyltransferase
VSVDAVIVLAAGAGTRMKSAAPKVLHEVLGSSIISHVLSAVAPVAPSQGATTVVVVGHGRELVTDHIGTLVPDASIVVQEQQNGTGHAVRLAMSALDAGSVDSVLVLAGDTPLLTSRTLREFVDAHNNCGAAVSVLSAMLPDPHGYGRIVRDVLGDVTAIVEQKDADEAISMINEINSGVYVFDSSVLRQHLSALTTDNAQGEEYLTDVVAAAVSAGQKVIAHVAPDHQEIWGINDRAQLASAAAVMRDRINHAHMAAGVTIVDPASTWIAPEVAIAADVVIEPGCQLLGATSIAAGAVIGPHTTLVDTEVGEAAHVRRTEATLAVIGPRADVGPFTYLRPGTQLAADTKAGAYVEIKAAQIGEGSKVPHLSYVGDATIGRDTNIGAATVFVNYDGVEKSRTIIGDSVRIGSDTMLVAPVEVGDGAYTAAGSVIIDNVPPGAMGVARARQRNVLDWVLRRRPGTSSAAAAQRAQQNGTAPQTNDTSVEAQG